MNTYIEIQKLLTHQAISFQTLNHPPTYTSEQSAEYRGESLATGAKAIVYKIEKSFYLFVLPADRKIDTKKNKNLF